MGCLQVHERVEVTNVLTPKYWNQGYLDGFYWKHEFVGFFLKTGMSSDHLR